MKIALSIAFMCCAFITAAHAQTPPRADARWTNWLGCWQLIDETQRASNPDPASLQASRPAPPSANDVSVCVTSTAEPAAVSLNTRVSNQPAFEQMLVADGADHPVTDADCRGDQRAEWSAAETLLFVNSHVICGDRIPRKISGLSVITGGIWVDVQAIDLAGREGIRVRRYRRAPDQPGSAIAARFGASSLTLDEVKEASGKIAAAAVEAALIATSSRFNLNSQRLIDLTDNGVRPNTIDLMVALSYPSRFTVERASGGSSGSIGTSFDPYTSLSYSPYFYAPLMYGYDYGYDPWVWYSGRNSLQYVPGMGFVLLDDSLSGTRAPDTDGGGRAINGVGYARVRPREASPDEAGGTSGQRGSSSGNGTYSGGDSTSSGSSSGSSGGGVTSGGFSSGSSSGDTGRTAEPR